MYGIGVFDFQSGKQGKLIMMLCRLAAAGVKYLQFYEASGKLKACAAEITRRLNFQNQRYTVTVCPFPLGEERMLEEGHLAEQRWIPRLARDQGYFNALTDHCMTYDSALSIWTGQCMQLMIPTKKL